MFSLIVIELVAILMLILFAFNAKSVFGGKSFIQTIEEIRANYTVGSKAIQATIAMDLFYMFFIAATMFYLMEYPFMTVFATVVVVLNIIVNPIKTILSYGGKIRKADYIFISKGFMRIQFVIEVVYILMFMYFAIDQMLLYS